MTKIARNWYTCTPVRFKGNELFFSRDSGLLCKGFQAIGVECKAILPGPPMEDDYTEDLIRTDYSNLEDAQWWRELGGEGVVFYGWGAGKYLKIVQAIKEAEMALVSHMDTGGLISILNGPLDYGASTWRIVWKEQKNLPMAIGHFLRRYLYASTIGLYFNDYRRAIHLREADFIGAITPIAMERIKKVCEYYGGDFLASRVALIPHPIPEYMIYDKRVPKEELVVAIGRWNDERVKGTKLLAKTINLLLSREHSVSVEVYGDPSSHLTDWYRSLADGDQARVFLKGQQPNSQLRHALQRASISLCTSMRESFHIVSAEALCCGASVVGPDIPEVPAMQWFATGQFGSLAKQTPIDLVEALSKELDLWRNGQRDPDQISAYWREILHETQIAKKVLNLVSHLKSEAF